jgi:DNA-binding MarR family transcriptional regulator
VTSRSTADDLAGDLERIAVASVALTARALAEVAPELTLLQWRVLVLLGQEADGVAVGAIAAALGSRLPAASRLVGRLRSHGLVETRKDAADARVTVASLTAAGRDLRADVLAARRRALAWAVSGRGLSLADAGAARRIAAVIEAAR